MLLMNAIHLHDAATMPYVGEKLGVLNVDMNIIVYLDLYRIPWLVRLLLHHSERSLTAMEPYDGTVLSTILTPNPDCGYQTTQLNWTRSEPALITNRDG